MHDDLKRDFDLAGRVAVVTGAASGIGRQTAKVLAEAGAVIVGTDIDGEGLDETRRLVEAAGGRMSMHVADIADLAAVEALARDTASGLGRLDIWINCAAVFRRKAILDTTEADFDAQIAVNLKSVYFACVAAARAMQAAGAGSIVNISSGGGDHASPGISVYSATKAGVNAITRACATEFGPLGIRVNAIAPGLIDTPMTTVGRETDPAKREAYFATIAKASPLNRIGAPRDIALAVLYLASDASSFVTGQVLRANGGAFML